MLQSPRIHFAYMNEFVSCSTVVHEQRLTSVHGFLQQRKHDADLEAASSHGLMQWRPHIPGVPIVPSSDKHMTKLQSSLQQLQIQVKMIQGGTSRWRP